MLTIVEGLMDKLQVGFQVRESAVQKLRENSYLQTEEK